MAKEKRKPLGRGLNSLIGNLSTDPVPADTPAAVRTKAEKPAKPAETAPLSSVQDISVDKIIPNPYQPRSTWNNEELAELTESIKANGVIQPILLRQTGTNYEIIAGERRLRASKNANLKTIPAIVRQASDEEMLELALVENIHRSDLNAIERALAYQQFITTFSLTQAQAAEKLGESRPVIANYLRLLDLPKEVKDMLIDNKLSMGHARAILALPTDDLRRRLANRALAGRLSVREVEKLVRKFLDGSLDQKPAAKEKPAHINDLEKRLRDVLGTKVQINTTNRGRKGKIVIDFYSLDEFDRLTEVLGLSQMESGDI